MTTPASGPTVRMDASVNRSKERSSCCSCFGRKVTSQEPLSKINTLKATRIVHPEYNQTNITITSKPSSELEHVPEKSSSGCGVIEDDLTLEITITYKQPV